MHLHNKNIPLLCIFFTRDKKKNIFSCTIFEGADLEYGQKVPNSARNSCLSIYKLLAHPIQYASYSARSTDLYFLRLCIQLKSNY